jgi:hypothetical protein
MESADDTDVFYFELPLPHRDGQANVVVELVFVAWELPSKRQILQFLGIESCPVLWPKEKLVATTGGMCAICNTSRADLVLCTYRCTSTGYAIENSDFREMCTDCVDPVRQSSFVDDHKKLIRLLETKFGKAILEEYTTLDAVTAFFKQHPTNSFRSSPNLIWQIPFIANPVPGQVISMQTFNLFADALKGFRSNGKTLKRAFVPFMVQFNTQDANSKPENLLNPSFECVQNNLWYDNALLIYLHRKGWLNFEDLMRSELPVHKRILSDSQFYADQHACIFGPKCVQLFADEDDDTNIEYIPGAERVNEKRTVTWAPDQVREFESDTKQKLHWWEPTQEEEGEETEKEGEGEGKKEEEEEGDEANVEAPNKRLKTKNVVILE